MIEIKNLNIAFKRNVILKNINLKMEPHKIYGVIGKNGAGKTTLLNAIAGGFPKVKGTIRINGIDPYSDATVLDKVCFVREDMFYAFKTVTVKNYFKSYKILYPKFDMSLAFKLATHFKIPLKKTFGNLSNGLQTIVIDLVGMCSMAEIIIFDEPTIGLDATNRVQFYEILLQHFATHQQTIIISTHQINETQNLFNHIVIVKEGEIAVDSEMDNLDCNPTELQEYFVELNKGEEFSYD
ncbi:hypothetical protein AN640_04635 [Candidatus Epulonipiscium fishelsonii]|uniref:Uncharacterized protein n=1 Tax=Candidatus Epulonipiscium fishelsonii TaxID=77094 RepID=A0ACC8XJA7_9FIRM|nr:hypothetical protein AN640_04635 [Epulopiscium sp. SCG-D08WGA-EpuloA1]OON90599.1 MAG: hypothetical protein ATN32_03585 [Epulopiscium sp. AS2M-Bin002]